MISVLKSAASQFQKGIKANAQEFIEWQSQF